MRAACGPRPSTLGCVGAAFAGVVLVVTKGDPRHAFEGVSLLRRSPGVSRRAELG
ncbi:MAG: hypothetical protein RML56_13200 [Burkholderiales bacterium]|nr:hypothetical protein [Burkholderiales bacterium]